MDSEHPIPSATPPRTFSDVFCYARAQERTLDGKFPLRMAGICRSVLRYLVIFANYAPGEYAGRSIARGELAVSQEHLSEQTGFSRKSIRNALRHLQNQNEICQKGAIEGANGVSLYIIVNYELWDAGKIKGPAKGHARGQQGATSKEEVNKENKEDTCVPTGRKRDLWLDQMAELWLEITGEQSTPATYGLFQKWRKSYGEEAPLQLAKDLVLKGRKLIREGKNTPEGYFVEALKGTRRNGSTPHHLENTPPHPPTERDLIAARRPGYYVIEETETAVKFNDGQVYLKARKPRKPQTES